MINAREPAAVYTSSNLLASSSSQVGRTLGRVKNTFRVFYSHTKVQIA